MLSKEKISKIDIESYIDKKLLFLDKLVDLNDSNFSLVAQNEDINCNILLLENLDSFKIDIAEVLEIFQGIRLVKCNRFTLFSSESICINADNDVKKVVSIIYCNQFEMINININKGKSHLYVDNSNDFQVKNIHSMRARGNGLTIFNSNNCRILDCQFANDFSSGINIIGESTYIQIKNTQVKYSKGPYNCDAGINIMHCTSSINEDKIPAKSHEDVSISSKNSIPKYINIENCIVQGCNAQGIYLEGPAFVNIFNSLIIDNRKEGICFDWGASFCNLSNSNIARNGRRNNYTEDDCSIDFLNVKDRDWQTTHLSQLAGISFDNAYSNLVYNNHIVGNYGGGIKLVRSCFENKFLSNHLTENSNYHQLFDLSRGKKYTTSEIMIPLNIENEIEFSNENTNLDVLISKMNLFKENIITCHENTIYLYNQKTIYDNSFENNVIMQNM